MVPPPAHPHSSSVLDACSRILHHEVAPWCQYLKPAEKRGPPKHHTDSPQKHPNAPAPRHRRPRRLPCQDMACRSGSFALNPSPPPFLASQRRRERTERGEMAVARICTLEEGYVLYTNKWGTASTCCVGRGSQSYRNEAGLEAESVIKSPRLRKQHGAHNSRKRPAAVLGGSGRHQWRQPNRRYSAPGASRGGVGEEGARSRRRRSRPVGPPAAPD